MRRRALAISYLILIVLLSLAGCHPHPSGPPEGVLRVMSYNIHHGESADGVFDLDAIARVIRRSGAQVVALQEVDRAWGERSQFLDEAMLLAAATGKHLAFGATLDQDPAPGRGEYGLAILSDYPIASSEMHLLPSELEQRGVLLVWLDTPDGQVPVACIHLGLSAADRAAQIAAALAWLPVGPELLLLGDLNSEPGAAETQAVFEAFMDVQAACGMGDVGTYYFEGAWRRIDYVFAGNGWEAVGCRVMEERASDHYPVVGDLGRSEG